MVNRYYVTDAGLRAAVVNEQVLETLKAIIAGQPKPASIARMTRQQFIAPNKRHDERVDHNMIIVSGAIDRLRRVVDSIEKPQPEPEPPAITFPRRPRVAYAHVPRRTIPPLTPAMQAIHEVFKRSTDPLTTADIMRAPEAATLNPVTIRWAIQQLRQRGLVENVTLGK